MPENKERAKSGPKGVWQEWVKPENLILLNGWARDGLTKKDIASKIGVREATIYEWCKVHSEIAEALKTGAEYADTLVVNALFQRAIGYETVEEVTEVKIDKNGQRTGNAVSRNVKKRVPPDVTAQIFWLKNRQPEKWRDVSHRQVGGNLNLPERQPDDGLLEAINKAMKEVQNEQADIPANLEG